jgi:hypothetical protein
VYVGLFARVDRLADQTEVLKLFRRDAQKGGGLGTQFLQAALQGEAQIIHLKHGKRLLFRAGMTWKNAGS